MKLSTTLAAATLATVATAKTRCGTVEPPADMKTSLNAAAFRGNSLFRNGTTRSVNTYVHVVTTQESEGKYSQEQVDKQMEVMNTAYGPSGIEFVTSDTDFTVNDEWAAVTMGSQAELDMKSSLKQGSYADLNIYLLSNLGDDLLGFCYFPKGDTTDNDLTLDGCSILADSMPDGDMTDYNLGYTSVHETGHWFGLFHVFEGQACSGKGDFVNDTPLQSAATDGCPATSDSCPDSPGQDSIHNYMDYSYDECLEEFSLNQNQRMFSIYDQYRAGK